MPRREFSTKVRVAAFARCEGRCEKCEAKLRPGNIEYDHTVPDGLGGDNSLENCQCLCKTCHKAKTTKVDVPTISKAKRVAAKHIGAKAPSRSVIPGSKRSKYKRKLDGTVVKR